ncbi:Mobile element protein [uncultured Microcoleus sp.]|uniref:Mobile element protein n=1 Tax=uncultured Microcoleus sp. TaxID=259945 RepID=A0A6J4KZD7_9CYAN|nr:Mobile element protein [uncultured Microcoleus sp.]
MTPEGADQLQPLLVANTLLANKGYDPDQGVIYPLNAEGKSAVISPRHHRKTLRTYDTKLYKARHLIENFFAKLKQYRAIAMRYDPRAVNFPACDSSRCCGHLVELMTRPKLT